MVTAAPGIPFFPLLLIFHGSAGVERRADAKQLFHPWLTPAGLFKTGVVYWRCVYVWRHMPSFQAQRHLVHDYIMDPGLEAACVFSSNWRCLLSCCLSSTAVSSASLLLFLLSCRGWSQGRRAALEAGERAALGVVVSQRVSGNVWEVQPSSTSLTPAIQTQHECIQCFGSKRTCMFNSFTLFGSCVSSLPLFPTCCSHMLLGSRRLHTCPPLS